MRERNRVGGKEDGVMQKSFAKQALGKGLLHLWHRGNF